MPRSFPIQILTEYRRAAAEDRAKRKEHNARLKSQAASNKRKRKAISEEISRSISPDVLLPPEDHPGKSDLRSKSGRKRPLPDRLPDEILATEPAIELPSESKPRKNLPSRKYKKSLEIDSKPPKDIKQGHKRIRVLPVAHKFLPPKSNAVSKSIREGWLMGRRGPKGEFTLPRKKMGGGFLVKR